MRSTGWLTSGMRHTERTLGILAEEGFAWHGDAVNDDNPYPAVVNGKTMIIVPYKNAVSGLNDTGMYRRGITARDVFNSFKDEFDLLYEESATEPKMLTWRCIARWRFLRREKFTTTASNMPSHIPIFGSRKECEIVEWVKKNCM